MVGMSGLPQLPKDIEVTCEHCKNVLELKAGDKAINFHDDMMLENWLIRCPFCQKEVYFYMRTESQVP